MGSQPGFLAPTKGKIRITVVLFIIIFLVLLGQSCGIISNLMVTIKLCPIDPTLPFDPSNLKPPIDVPLTCDQVCTQTEYNSKIMNIAVTRFVLPLAGGYLLACFIVPIFSAFRKKN